MLSRNIGLGCDVSLAGSRVGLMEVELCRGPVILDDVASLGVSSLSCGASPLGGGASSVGSG